MDKYFCNDNYFYDETSTTMSALAEHFNINYNDYYDNYDSYYKNYNHYYNYNNDYNNNYNNYYNNYNNYVYDQNAGAAGRDEQARLLL